MVVYVDGLKDLSIDREKEEAVMRWIALNPVAAARLILMLMPEGNWVDVPDTEH